jgi:hypothetical protein
LTATSAPFGFRATRNRFGGTPRPKALRGGIASGYATAIYRGDPIKLVTSGTFQLAAAGEAITGIFDGWLPEDAGVWLEGKYWKASTTYTKAPLVFWYPIDDASIEFQVQANGAVAATAVGDSADYVAGTGNTNNGLSGAVLSSTLVGAAASGQFKIVGLWDAPDSQNTWGDAKTIVRVIGNEPNTGLIPGNAI